MLCLGLAHLLDVAGQYHAQRVSDERFGTSYEVCLGRKSPDSKMRLDP
jgi:hypothetical protein